MPNESTLSTVALSDDEYETLAAFFDTHGALDIDELLGFLNAIAVAPSLLPPSTWLPVVLREPPLAGIDERELNSLLGLLFRQYNEVVDALDRNALIAPDAAAHETCMSFAAGFAAGAQLDPTWIGNDDHWSFASPLAYLGGRRDLVPAPQLERLDADPDAKAHVRRQMTELIGSCYDTFKKYRRAQQHPSPSRSAPRVGRNEPCPCGSGRKYKRCCSGTPQPASHE